MGNLNSDWPIEKKRLTMVMGVLVYSFSICLRLLSLDCSSFGTRTQLFPRGMGASILPFGWDR